MDERRAGRPRGPVPGKIGEADEVRLAAAADLYGIGGDRLLSETDPFERAVLKARVGAALKMDRDRMRLQAQEIADAFGFGGNGN